MLSVVTARFWGEIQVLEELLIQFSLFVLIPTKIPGTGVTAPIHSPYTLHFSNVRSNPPFPSPRLPRPPSLSPPLPPSGLVFADFCPTASYFLSLCDWSHPRPPCHGFVDVETPVPFSLSLLPSHPLSLSLSLSSFIDKSARLSSTPMCVSCCCCALCSQREKGVLWWSALNGGFGNLVLRKPLLLRDIFK